MKLTTVFQAFNPADAQMVRARLEVAGFHPWVAHEGAALSMDGYAMAIGGILVQVPEDEAVEAKEFLDSAQDTQDDTPLDPTA